MGTGQEPRGNDGKEHFRVGRAFGGAGIRTFFDAFKQRTRPFASSWYIFYFSDRKRHVAVMVDSFIVAALEIPSNIVDETEMSLCSDTT